MIDEPSSYLDVRQRLKAAEVHLHDSICRVCDDSPKQVLCSLLPVFVRTPIVHCLWPLTVKQPATGRKHWHHHSQRTCRLACHHHDHHLMINTFALASIRSGLMVVCLCSGHT